MSKRPQKQVTIGLIMSQFALMNAKVPGYTPETTKVVLKQQEDCYLFQSEVDAILEANKDVEGFDSVAFKKFLVDFDLVKVGGSAHSGEGTTRIDSIERAKEVANEPNDAKQVETIQKIVSAMVELRKKLNPLINKNSQCSIALKNKTAITKETKKSPEKSKDVSSGNSGSAQAASASKTS